ncbi:hypothetical protein C8Q75DRAFT_719089 [Abortiporus biennis]|nr:hypothetical protein C8Q75DRAFT_719089 [Abortiporus biennis]
MVSLTASSSFSSLHSIPQQLNYIDALPSPTPSYSSPASSSSSLSLNHADEENATINASRFSAKRNGKPRSSQDLQLLAISTQITEISYSISDIQTRIFEIQELRHKSQSGEASSASSVIDQSLATLDERIEAVTGAVKSVNTLLEPVLQSVKTPTQGSTFDNGDDSIILRKHAAMLSDWESVQKDSQVLREELKEDKWLTVFRTVTDQADGMMASLEKAVNRCQDFIYRVQRNGMEDTISQSSRGSTRSEKSPVSFEVFNTILDSYEAKKKHYMPATTKVLSIIDKGVQDRVTKNGECLRRHAESTQRWRNLKERISRTDSEMEQVRKMFLSGEMTPSEAGSSTSGTGLSQSQKGFLATPPAEPRPTKSKGSGISRSISPFRKLARKIKGKSPKPSPKPTPAPLKKAPSKTPSTEPVPTLRHRASLFNLLGGSTPVTPTTPSHKHSQSLTPDSSPSVRRAESRISNHPNSSPLKKPAWNSSTKVGDDERGQTIKLPSQRRPSVSGYGPGSYRNSEDTGSSSSPYKRSLSRSSMASSRPWSPVTSSVSTAHSSTQFPSPFPLFRPPSRATTPGLPLSPRSRPKTPSHIPAPSQHFRSMSASVDGDDDWDDAGISSRLERAFSPTMSLRCQTPSGHPPRPPSRSMIPVPSVQISSASRPSSAMSHYRPDSSMSFRANSYRAQTPEGALRMTPRPSVITQRLPPSSFKDSSTPKTPGQRPPSRSGAATPTEGGRPNHIYVPASQKDPLDVEFARVVNNIPHSLLIERVDPPLRNAPKEGEEVRAQYAFSNSLGRKIVNCKLTTLTRLGKNNKEGVTSQTTKKVMCRVGGGWQDLHLYILNRQAGI